MSGLYQYECDGCAACCTQFTVTVTEDDCRREPLVEAATRRVALLMADAGFLARDARHLSIDPIADCDIHCPLLTEGGSCSVHLTKPDVCARFPPGGSLCQWARGRAGLGTLRPIIDGREG